ncbi:hypothetical protein B0H13DRAFT_1906851 [Mycena leptocephala]|nr:hypothetical protein B0H13DRAFT_1906851 [Mycena leptocephala]
MQPSALCSGSEPHVGQASQSGQKYSVSARISQKGRVKTMRKWDCEDRVVCKTRNRTRQRNAKTALPSMMLRHCTATWLARRCFTLSTKHCAPFWLLTTSDDRRATLFPIYACMVPPQPPCTGALFDFTSGSRTNELPPQEYNTEDLC